MRGASCHDNDARTSSAPAATRPPANLTLVVLPPVTPELWRLIDAARSQDHTRRRAALDALARRYQTPLRRLLLSLGVRYQDVPDLANEFLGFVLPQRVLPIADPARGSFNGLLLRALRNHLADRRRDHLRRAALHEYYLADARSRLTIRARAAPGPAGMTPAHRERSSEADRVATALRAAQQHFIATGRRDHWRAFALYVLVPLCIGAKRPSLDEVGVALAASAESPGALSAPQVASLVRIVRDRVRSELQDRTPPRGALPRSA